MAIRPGEYAGLRIFVSYRRSDAPINAGRIADNLEFRKAAVFVDTELPAGADFASAIEEEIEECDAVLVVIGGQWLGAPSGDGTPAIADPADWVHVEVRLALERGAVIFPVLVDGAVMPSPGELPEPLRALARRNAIELRRDSWRADFERLLADLPLPRERQPQAEGDEPLSWPSRFRDDWFEHNVPSMSEAQFRLLRAELYRRRWTDDEIRDRVLPHSPHDFEERIAPMPAPALQRGSHARPPDILELEPEDPVARGAKEASLHLAEIGRDPTARIIERTLANALAASLGGRAERRVEVPGWDPQPGRVDVVTFQVPGRVSLAIETKLKDDVRLLEILYDIPKLLSIDTEDHLRGVYLVVGSTVANWAKPGVGAEFLSTGRHELVTAIERHRDFWVRSVLPDSAGRPTAVPEMVDVTRVARIALDMRGERWEIRAARLGVPDGTPWTGFEEGLPA